jgi:hypothetical protein
MNEEERKNSNKRLFYEIIDVVCRNVSVRLSENAKFLFVSVGLSENSELLFLSLLDARYFPMYRTSFPEKAFLCFKR